MQYLKRGKRFLFLLLLGFFATNAWRISGLEKRGSHNAALSKDGQSLTIKN